MLNSSHQFDEKNGVKSEIWDREDRENRSFISFGCISIGVTRAVGSCVEAVIRGWFTDAWIGGWLVNFQLPEPAKWYEVHWTTRTDYRCPQDQSVRDLDNHVPASTWLMAAEQSTRSLISLVI